MEELHSALGSLGPTDFDNVSADNDDDLYSYTRDLVTKSYRVAESVPPSSSRRVSNSSDKNSRTTTTTTTNNNGAGHGFGRDALPPDIASMQKGWGKPVNKVDDAKENPLHIPVYKLASKDGKGAWFARRSVHEGMSFDRWKAKLMDEFEETRRIRERNGGALEGGSIRGLGCEKRLDRIDVPAATDKNTHGGEEDSGVCFGSLEVHHLSAIFPGPSTPRDFVTLLITSDTNDADTKGSGDALSDPQRPRNYMIISKPCKHSAVPPRKGFVRGEYESIELLSEITGNATEGDSRDTTENGSCDGKDEKSKSVEWIMITRSDPGGSIPRWMVEKGTTPSILDDARKFIEWAYQDEADTDEHERQERPPQTATGRTVHFPGERIGGQAESAVQDSDETDFACLVDGVVGLVSLALNVITPQVLRDGLHDSMRARNGNAALRGPPINTYSKESDHEPFPPYPDQDAPALPPESNASHGSSSRKTTVSSTGSNNNASMPPSETASNPPNKELAKLSERKRNIEQELSAVREEAQALRKPKEKNTDIVDQDNTSRARQSSSPASSGQLGDTNGETLISSNEKNKASIAREKSLTALERKEAKLTSQIVKIEGQEQKVAAQAEARQRKEAKKNERRNTRGETEKYQEIIRGLREEVRDLKQERQQWVELLGRLQKENTRLVAQGQGRAV